MSFSRELISPLRGAVPVGWIDVVGCLGRWTFTHGPGGSVGVREPGAVVAQEPGSWITSEIRFHYSTGDGGGFNRGFWWMATQPLEGSSGSREPA